MLEIKTTKQLDTSGLYLWCNSFLQLLSEFRNIDNTEEIASKLNMINNQGVSNISFRALTYEWHGRVYSLLDMGTAEKMFLVTCCAIRLGKHLNVVDYPDELSPRASRIYMELFREADVTVYLKNRSSAFAKAAREAGVCLQW